MQVDQLEQKKDGATPLEAAKEQRPGSEPAKLSICLYYGHYNWVEKSGIGRARVHQFEALTRQQSEAPLDVHFDYRPSDRIVHINTVFLSSWWRAVLARWRGQLVVYHAHSTSQDFRNSFRFSNLLAPLFGFWLRCCYRQSDLVLTPTDYARQLLEGYGLGRPIEVVSNGIDLSAFYPSAERRQSFRQRYGWSEDETVVLSVGHYMERKGFTDFLALAKRHPDWHFIWFGYTAAAVLSEPVREALKHKPDNVLLPGFVRSDELAEAYAGSDLFLFLTHEETEGIVLLEALASGVPVLVRDIEIYRDWVPEGEAVYKATDLASFDQTMQAMLSGVLPSTEEGALALAESRSLPVVGERLLSLYQEAMHKQQDRWQKRWRRRPHSASPS